MKDILLYLSLIFFLVSCYKDPVDIPEMPVLKTVQFAIAQGNDYSSSIYDGLNAELKIAVAKESTVDGKILAVWDTTFTLRSIREYSPSVSPFLLTKEYTGLWQSSQALRVSHSIRYVDAANRTWQSALGEVIPSSITRNVIAVNL